VRTSCRGLMLLGAVERRGAFVVGMRDVIFAVLWFDWIELWRN
jgi:hypothetical protein